MSRLFVDYTNHRGERAWREIVPASAIHMQLYPPSLSKEDHATYVARTGKQPEVVPTIDVEMRDRENAKRTLALTSIHGFAWQDAKPGSAEALQQQMPHEMDEARAAGRVRIETTGSGKSTSEALMRAEDEADTIRTAERWAGQKIDQEPLDIYDAANLDRVISGTLHAYEDATDLTKVLNVQASVKAALDKIKLPPESVSVSPAVDSAIVTTLGEIARKVDILSMPRPEPRPLEQFGEQLRRYDHIIEILAKQGARLDRLHPDDGRVPAGYSILADKITQEMRMVGQLGEQMTAQHKSVLSILNAMSGYLEKVTGAKSPIAEYRPMKSPAELTFGDLTRANETRQKLWDVGTNGQVSLLYRATELGGEVGELLNKVKKWEREQQGIKGSRTNLGEITKEIGDVVICCDLLATMLGIDVSGAVSYAFNRTSQEVGFDILL